MLPQTPIISASRSRRIASGSKWTLWKRHRHFHLGSRARLALQPKFTTDALGALADSDQAEVAAHSGKCIIHLKAATIINDFQIHHSCRSLKFHLDPAGVGVLRGVGNRFLRDSQKI